MYDITCTGEVFRNGRKLKLKRLGKYFGFTECINNVKHNKYIHREVATKYIPNPLNLPEINHKNGNRADNHVSNLEWCTRKQNDNHARNTGLIKQNGEDSVRAKLTEVQVKYIKKHKSLFKQRQLAKMFNVSDCTISEIINGKSWKHIT